MLTYTRFPRPDTRLQLIGPTSPRMHSLRPRSAPSKRPRASLQRKTPYPPLGTVVDADMSAPVQKQRKRTRRRACDHCKAARRRCTLPTRLTSSTADIAAEDIAPSSESSPSCEQCTAAQRECSYDGKTLPGGEIGSAEGWSEWKSVGRVVELDDRLARLERAVAAKIQEIDRSAELDDDGAPSSPLLDSQTLSDVSPTSDMAQDGVRRIEDGVRRLSFEQGDRSPSFNPTESLVAGTNERRLTQALSSFELAWLHAAVAPAPGPWSAVSAVEDERTERMALELRDVVEELSGSPINDIASPVGRPIPPTSHATTSSARSDLFHWRDPADSHPSRSLEAHSSFPSSPQSSTFWTESSSPSTPHSPYTPSQIDYSQPQVAPFFGAGGEDGSPIAFGKLRLNDEKMAGVDSDGRMAESWRGSELLGTQRVPVSAPRGRARTLDEAFQPRPPLSYHLDYAPPRLNTFQRPLHHPYHPSLGLWDASPSPPHPSHSSLGLLFDAVPHSPASSNSAHHLPLTRTHSLDSTPSTPPPFNFSPLAAESDQAPAPSARIRIKHGHRELHPWDGRYDERLWEGIDGGSSLAGFAGEVGASAEGQRLRF